MQPAKLNTEGKTALVLLRDLFSEVLNFYFRIQLFGGVFQECSTFKTFENNKFEVFLRNIFNFQHLNGFHSQTL